MDWAREHYGKEYAPNTRETFRRQSMHQFCDAGVAGNQRFTLGQIGGEAVMPCGGAEGTQQGQRGGFDL
ncbi:hypothetical protein, partial [Aeromonas caviae]